MMQSNEALLDVRSRTHFLRTAEKDANLAGAHVTKQRQLSRVRVVVLDESNVSAWHAKPFEFFRHVTINREPTVLGRGQVAKNHLGGSLRRCRLPDAMNVLDGLVDLPLRLVPCRRFYLAEIPC